MWNIIKINVMSIKKRKKIKFYYLTLHFNGDVEEIQMSKHLTKIHAI